MNLNQASFSTKARTWLLLAGMGSFMLLAVTNHITHDVASVPFLWILPLTLYLLTFILCFEGRRGRGWYRRAWFIGPLLVIVGGMAWALYTERGIVDMKQALSLFAGGLFLMCMFFHGELAAMGRCSGSSLGREKPSVRSQAQPPW